MLQSMQSQAVRHEQATELTDQVKSMSTPIGIRGFFPHSLRESNDHQLSVSAKGSL